jgi:hypothetical protein
VEGTFRLEQALTVASPHPQRWSGPRFAAECIHGFAAPFSRRTWCVPLVPAAALVQLSAPARSHSLTASREYQWCLPFSVRGGPSGVIEARYASQIRGYCPGGGSEAASRAAASAARSAAAADRASVNGSACPAFCAAALDESALTGETFMGEVTPRSGAVEVWIRGATVFALSPRQK